MTQIIDTPEEFAARADRLWEQIAPILQQKTNAAARVQMILHVIRMAIIDAQEAAGIRAAKASRRERAA